MKYVPLKQRMGITFQDAEYWLLDMKKAGCFSHFLKGLGPLFSPEETLYLEGCSIHPKVRAFLEAHAAPSPVKVALGSSWPRPLTFHMALEPVAVEELFVLALRYTVNDFCDRVHVYRGNEVLLDGHDILDQQCKVTLKIDSGKLKKFCRKLNATYIKSTP